MSLKKINELPSQEYLIERFTYEDSTGKLFWNKIDENSTLSPMSLHGIRIFNSQRAGNEAGHKFKETNGTYAIQVRIDGVSYYIHRIIYKLITGIDAELIDHEDGDRLNNRFYNLRDVSNAVNTKNCKKSIKNTSGVTGVSLSKQTGKWEAYIWNNNKKYNLGHFHNIEDAIEARKTKEIEFNYHKNHGKR